MPIEGFYIYYKLYSFPGHYQREQVIGSQFRYHVLRGLQPGAEYSLRMQCFNMAGEGEYSNTVVKRTLGKCTICLAANYSFKDIIKFMFILKNINLIILKYFKASLKCSCC